MKRPISVTTMSLTLLAVAVRAQVAIPLDNPDFTEGPVTGIVAWNSAPGYNGTTVFTYADPSPGPSAWIINFGGAGVDGWSAPYDKVLSMGWGGARSQVYQYSGFQVTGEVVSITVSADVLNGEGAGSGNFRLGFTGNPQDENGSNIYLDGPQFFATTNWQRFSYTVNVADHPGIVGKFVMPWLSTDDGNWSNHQRWDNVTLEYTAAPTGLTYAAWAGVWAGSSPPLTDTDGAADPDGDGFDNNEEYAFGGNPTVGTPGLLSMVSSNASFLALNGATNNYTVQQTTNLATGPWTDAAEGFTVSTNQADIPLPGSYTRWQFSVPTGTGQGFFRVRYNP